MKTEEQNQNKPQEFHNFRKMYEELKEAGYPDMNDFKNGNEYNKALKSVSKSLDEFIKIVIKWLPKIEYRVGGLLLLAETNKKYDGRVIIPIFKESNSFDKWRICSAIAYNPPLNINDWVRDTYLSKEYGYSETGLLPLAIAKMFPRDEARKILKQGFDHHYRVTPEALGKVGTAEDIPFLEKKLLINYDATHVHKDIEKAIKRIKKRAKLN